MSVVTNQSIMMFGWWRPSSPHWPRENRSLWSTVRPSVHLARHGAPTARLLGPTDLTGLFLAALAVPAAEIRTFLIDKVAGTIVFKRLVSTHRGKTASKEI